MCDDHGLLDRDGRCLRVLVKERAAQQGLSNAQLIRNLGTSRETFYGWLRGDGISPRSARAASEALGVSADAVLAASARPACPGPDTSRTQLSDYGRAVTDATAAAGMSLAQLVARSGVGRSSLYDALNGARRPIPAQIRAVARVLGLDPVELGRAAGEKVDGPPDELRLQLGLSRLAYAQRAGVPPEMLFGGQETQRPAVAHAVAVAGGASVDEAAAAARAVRLSAARCPLGKLIEGGLDRLGWTATELAAHLGVKRQTLQKWIAGTCRPLTTSRAALAAQLGVEVALIDAAIANGAPPHLATGRQLRELRVAAGLLQSDVAKVLGISDPGVSALETGNRRLTATKADRLAQVYGWDLRAEDVAVVATAAA